ncbi:hypothetical protein H4R22_001623 [Coemansia sp. RSA 1290]|nr:hypothetical protein H4R22_001623 [Coemansia sp. RSA 1290]KAJ2649108.1 hypothetical protein IWW40_003370 [Coemansia sp. RSA 1250]
MSKSATSFIADDCKTDYPLIYDRETQEEADVHSLFLNVKHANGTTILERVTTIKCSSCVIVVVMAFPEITGQRQKELQVEMLDGAMKRVNITREREAQQRKPKKSIGHAMQSRQGVKAAFIVERPDVASVETEETGRRASGPLIAFCTGSVSHLLDADTSDVMNYPFLKLVAPECIAHVSRFFDRLIASTDVMFDTFALLKHPHIIEGDIFVAEEENPRVIVECLGAASEDGIALLLRLLSVEPPPAKDKLSTYIEASIRKMDEDSGYSTLADIISSSIDTSDAASEWSHLP